MKHNYLYYFNNFRYKRHTVKNKKKIIKHNIKIHACVIVHIRMKNIFTISF